MGSRIVDVRKLQAQQFQPLLQAESRAWFDGLHWDYAPSAGLISTYLGEKRLAGFALLEDDLARGYCLYFREGPKGLIGSLFVEPGDSRAGSAPGGVGGNARGAAAVAPGRGAGMLGGTAGRGACRPCPGSVFPLRGGGGGAS